MEGSREDQEDDELKSQQMKVAISSVVMLLMIGFDDDKKCFCPGLLSLCEGREWKRVEDTWLERRVENCPSVHRLQVIAHCNTVLYSLS